MTNHLHKCKQKKSDIKSTMMEDQVRINGNVTLVLQQMELIFNDQTKMNNDVIQVLK